MSTFSCICNNGFFDVLVAKKDDEEVDGLGAAMAKVKLEDDDEPRVRSLPDVNFLDFAKVKVDALLEEALPGDRQRLRAHLAKNALGFVLVTALRLKYSPTCLRLLAVARGEITWQEYESGTMVEKAVIKDMFRTTLKYADILCTTPALGCRDEFRDWREEKAQAILLSWGPYFTNRYMSKVKYGIETRLKSQILT
ncbi:hypothetical protein MKX08_000082 [Trichoderma sp. CBMAI-0020]|nr:hypothetical protein MKX08_000082 [Trichoderma sp. CBMAI-0020]